MKYLKLLLIGGLVLALSSPMWGTTLVPFTQAWQGPIYMHVHDFSQGTTYDGTIYDGVSSYVTVHDGTNWYNQSTGAYDLPGTASPLYDPYDATHPLGKIGPKAGKVGEDGWSVIQIDQIFKGKDYGFNTIGPIDIANPLYSVGPDQDVEVVATLFNAHDIGVQFQNTTLNKFAFESTGDTFEIYAQPTDTFDQGAAGSSGRLMEGGVYVDKYATIGYDAAGNPILGSDLNLSGTGAKGFFGTLDDTERVGSFTMMGTTGTGDGDEYFIALAGPLMDLWGYSFTEGFFVPSKDGYDNADLRVHVTNTPVIQDGDFDWLVQSSDPLTSYVVVPEPVTMAGLLLGIGFLGRYVRRRR